MELMGEDDPRAVTIDRIAARSGVSKTTIYKWWPDKTAVVVDAFQEHFMKSLPIPDTGSVAEDFRVLLRGIMAFYSSPIGKTYAQIVGESQSDPGERERIRTHQVIIRRQAVSVIWQRGVQRGELNSRIDPEVAMDLVFGAAMYRMAVGHGGLTDADADAIVNAVMKGFRRTLNPCEYQHDWR